MESFEDLINEQILNELGVLGSLGQKVSRSLATAPHAIAAKLGSKSAKGTLNLYDQVHALQDNFHTYCAEQQIHMPTREDFFDFLVHHCGLTMPEENIQKGIYGTAGTGEAPNAAKIAQLYDQAAVELEHNEDVSQSLNSLAAYTTQKNPDGSAARKALWGLARNHPGSLGAFNDVADAVGMPMNGADVGRMITNVAKLMLKTSKGVGKDHKLGASGEKVDPTDLDVGRVVYDPDLGTQGRRNTTLADQLTQYGITKIASLLEVSKSLDAEEGQAQAAAFAKKFSKNALINIARILLQTYRAPTNRNKLKDFTNRFKGDAAFVGKLNELLGNAPKKKNASDPSDPKLYYDGTDFNKAIAVVITSQQAAANMLTVLIHSLAEDRAL